MENNRATRKKKRKILVVIAALCLFLLIAVSAIAVGTGYYFHYFSFGFRESHDDLMTADAPLTEDDFLSVSDGKIVNRRGETVILEGVNLGGWLLQEYWMCPVKGSEEISQWTNLETLNVLEERFGEEKAQALIQEYEDQWITEWDIRNIVSMGCNVVRVPFWYRNFMTNPEGDWIQEDPDHNPGFQRLDWLIEQAEKYGLYVILDMHGCPGGQSKDHCAGSARRSELFTNPAYQDAMEKLWISIASRYKDSPAVAAYDIMNEPQIENDTADTAQDPRNLLYDRMLKAIRQVDGSHMIILEGIWSLSELPHPDEMGWTNVVYEVHAYGITDPEAECQKYTEYSQQYKVPVYVGEFSDMRLMVSCRRAGIHYTSWTYKGDRYMDDSWFMYYGDRLLSADLYRDPYWLIKLKWGQCLSTQYFNENNEILKLWNKSLSHDPIL